MRRLPRICIFDLNEALPTSHPSCYFCFGHALRPRLRFTLRATHVFLRTLLLFLMALTLVIMIWLGSQARSKAGIRIALAGVFTLAAWLCRIWARHLPVYEVHQAYVAAMLSLIPVPRSTRADSPKSTANELLKNDSRANLVTVQLSILSFALLPPSPPSLVFLQYCRPRSIPSKVTPNQKRCGTAETLAAEQADNK